MIAAAGDYVFKKDTFETKGTEKEMERRPKQLSCVFEAGQTRQILCLHFLS
jgi:hypothetical protein